MTIDHLVWGLWCFNATFNNILYRGGQFYWQRKPEYPVFGASQVSKRANISILNLR